MAKTLNYEDPFPRVIPFNATRAPAFQFYADKWVSGTSHLSPESYKAYSLLICYLWDQTETQFSMPDTDNAWAKATRICDRNSLAAVRAEIQDEDEPMLKNCEETSRTGKAMIYSNGLKKERMKQIAKSRKATISAYIRHQVTFDPETLRPLCERNANATKQQCSPSPSPTPATLSPPKPPAGGKPRSRRLSIGEQKRTRVEANSPTMERLGALFKRRAGTLWTVYELNTLNSIGKVHPDDLPLLEHYYGMKIPKDENYRRTRLDTLLNNFQGELDRARPIVYRDRKRIERKGRATKTADAIDGKEMILYECVDSLVDVLTAEGAHDACERVVAVRRRIAEERGEDFYNEANDIAKLRAAAILKQRGEDEKGVNEQG